MNSVRIAHLFGVAALVAACASSGGTLSDRSKEAAVANMNLGAGYLRQGRYDLAVERLERALKQNPKLADAHSTIAIAYDQLGMPEEAEKHYRRATQLEPDNAAAANSYAVFLCLHNRWPDAEPFFKRAADNRSYTTPEAALTNAGVCARNAGATDKAEQYFRDALMRNPTFPDALYNMMELSYQQQNFLEARAFVQRYLDSQKATAPVLLMCFNVERELKNDEAADRCAKQMRTEFQGTPEIAKLEEEQRGDGR
jgi:type IV pilus assembly protein PilF